MASERNTLKTSSQKSGPDPHNALVLWNTTYDEKPTPPPLLVVLAFCTYREPQIAQYKRYS